MRLLQLEEERTEKRTTYKADFSYSFGNKLLIVVVVMYIK